MYARELVGELRRKTPTRSPHSKVTTPKNKPARSPGNSNRYVTQTLAVGRQCLKQNTPMLLQEGKGSNRLLQLRRTTTQQLGMEADGEDSRQIDQLVMRISRNELIDVVRRIFKKRLAFGFQKVKEQLLLGETSLTSLSDTNGKPVYSYDRLPELLEALSNVYKRRYQHSMVEAFTKIAYELKKAQEREEQLRQLVNRDRRVELYQRLKRQAQQGQLQKLTLSFAFKRFLNKAKSFVSLSRQYKDRKTVRAHTEDSSSLGESVRMNSSAKISRLLGGIKKDKAQPSENIYVRYQPSQNQQALYISQRFSETLPSAMDMLNDRVQRLQNMLESARTQGVPNEKKFQSTRVNWSKSELCAPVDFTSSKLTTITSSKRFIQSCPICLLTFCICRKPMKDEETQCDFTASPPPPVFNTYPNPHMDLPRSESLHQYVFNPAQHQQVDVVYVPETILRPVLVERPQTYQFNTMQSPRQGFQPKTNLTVHQHPKMQPDVLFRTFDGAENRPAPSPRHPISRRDRDQQPYPADRSLSKRTKFLKITSRRPSQHHLL